MEDNYLEPYIGMERNSDAYMLKVNPINRMGICRVRISYAAMKVADPKAGL